MNILKLITGYKLEFVDKKHIKEDVYSFRFHPLEPITFTAGQHFFFSAPSYFGMKPFSLASAPEDSYVTIGTHVHSYSKFKQSLNKLKPGDGVTVRGPAMNFTLKGSSKDVVFLAQGIGITPFRSILRHIAAAKLDIKTTLIHVEEKDHILRNETEKLATIALYPTNRKDFLKQLEKTLQQKPNATYYISGAKSFIQSTRDFLKKNGVQKIKVDQFIGY